MVRPRSKDKTPHQSLTRQLPLGGEAQDGLHLFQRSRLAQGGQPGSPAPAARTDVAAACRAYHRIRRFGRTVNRTRGSSKQLPYKAVGRVRGNLSAPAGAAVDDVSIQQPTERLLRWWRGVDAVLFEV